MPAQSGRPTDATTRFQIGLLTLFVQHTSASLLIQENADPDVRKLIDFEKPIGLLLFAILHHVKDDDEPGRIAAQLRDAMPDGSYLALSSLRLPGPELPALRAVTIEGEKLLVGTLGSGRWREDEEILTWFGDWELLEPGLVSILDWRPAPGTFIERDENYHSFFGGVARKPAR